MSLAPGVRLGPYEITGLLGKGGMGEVYRARDSRLDRDVAVKTLPQESGSNPESRRRFEREARAAASLAHPNVVSLFDVGEQDGVRYVVTEIVEGETLRTRLSHGVLGTAEAAEIGAQIAQGLAAAHEKGLVHRDLKPENVMLTPAGTVKILDFGLAHRTPRPVFDTDQEPTQSAVLSEVGTIAGTAGYMSPEQVRGETLDPRSDIFSLGTVLYELLTGRRAFRAGSTVETLNAILKEEPPLAGASLPSLSPEMGRILSRCLAKRRDDRYHSAADLAHDLRAAATGGSVSSPSLPLPARSPARRRALTLVTLAAAALLAAAVVAIRARRASSTGAPRTLAVLPFRTIGTEPIPHFGLGLADAVISRLASIRTLTVRPTSAISRFEQTPADAMGAGKQLDVEAVLEGSLQKLEGTTRVSIQLTDVSRGGIVWSEALDLPEGRLFEVQDQIARRVAERLSGEVTPAEEDGFPKAQQVPDEVMEQYFAARARLPDTLRMSLEGRRELVAQFDRIIERVPNFSRAIGARSYARAWLNFQSPSPEGYEAVLRDAERALSLDPDLPEPRVARASLYWSFAGGWKVVEAVRELKTAIARNPGSEVAHLDLSRIYYHTGWLEEARKAAEPAARLNPTGPEVIRVAGHIAWMAGDHRRALMEYQRLPPDLLREILGGRWQVLHLRLILEDPKPLLKEIEDWVGTLPEGGQNTWVPHALLAVARVRAGRMDIADLERKITSVDPRHSAGHFHHIDHLLADAHALRGDAARSVEYLRRASETGLNCAPAFDTDPFLQPIRESTEYRGLKAEMAKRDAAYRAALKDLL